MKSQSILRLPGWELSFCPEFSCYKCYLPVLALASLSSHAGKPEAGTDCLEIAVMWPTQS